MRQVFLRISMNAWLAAAVALATLVLLLVTIHQPLITWDEGFTIEREEKVRAWFEYLVSPPGGVTRSSLFEAGTLNQSWPFAREEPDGHPPFYAIIGNAGWLLSHHWLNPLAAHRFGPILLFSLTAAVMFQFIATRWGRLAGIAAAGSWVLMPRIFAHAHLASYDVPLACLWFLAVVAFWKAIGSETKTIGRGRVASLLIFALVLALAAATKFTGWLIPLPLVAWSIVAGVRSIVRDGWVSIRRVMPAAICVVPLLALAPPLVHRVLELDRLERAAADRFPSAEDSQQRAHEAAEQLRSSRSSGSVAWLLAAPIAIWVGIQSWRRLRAESKPGPAGLPGVWAAAIALTPALTVALVPNWWPAPLEAIAIFLWSNLTRQHTTWIPTQFFGTTYPFALPWYNTLAWVGLTVPPLSLILMTLGVLAAIGAKRRDDRGSRIEDRASDSSRDRRSSILDPPSSILTSRSLAVLLLLNGAALLVIRALPGAPGHDGERQLIASFPFLACLAGVGAESLRAWLARRLRESTASWIARGVIALSLAHAASAIWHYRSAPLSYYTELVGGVHGATALGLEPTYYWDALDADTINWLKAHTPPGDKVLFSSYFKSLDYLRRWEHIQFGFKPAPVDRGQFRWYVLQNRPGLFTTKAGDVDRWLAEHGRTARLKSLDGVPLIWVFPIEEFEKASEANRGETQPQG